MPASTPSFEPHPLDAVSDSMQQVFVVGTGRCGSTLVSTMLRQHPGLLSLSELFSFISDLGCAIADVFPPGLVTGEQMWALLAAQLPRQNLMIRHDVAMPEVLYPWQAGTSRFNQQSGVPAISQVCLPHLTATPDALFDQLQAMVCALPPAPIGVQYRRVFAGLAQQQGARGWVERSGGGLRIVARLIEHFPAARFIHIVRNGPDTALSMSQHRGFRMVFAAFQLLEVLGADPFVSSERRWQDDLTDEQIRLLPENFSKQALLDFSTPPPLCGHYWSGEIRHGLPVLQSLAADHLLTIRYEDILQYGADTAERMLRFILPDQFGTGDAAWVERVAAMVGRPTGNWQRETARCYEQTVQSCQPGMTALAQAGL
jgi:Sulfotransferase family